MDENRYIEHCIFSGKNGLLTEPTMRLDSVFAGVERHLSSNPTASVVVHIHGGLVSRQWGERNARASYKAYLEGGAYPLFVIWQSGAFEVIRNNPDELIVGILREIASEAIFHRLSNLLRGWLEGRVASLGSESVEVPMTAAEEQELATVLEADPELRVAVDELRDAVLAQGATPAERISTSGTEGAPPITFLSQSVIDELTLPSQSDFEAFGWWSVVRRGVEITREVLKRYGLGQDHGLWPTVVEELLRNLYGDILIGNVWGVMKKETFDTFIPSEGSLRAGIEILRWLNTLLRTHPDARISLVGHSTGAVFINNMIERAAGALANGDLPEGFQFQNVIFLAPACTYAGFVPTVRDYVHLFRNFRMFTMRDELEQADVLLPNPWDWVYTASLLYFISGLLETDRGGQRIADLPILGMQRFHRPGLHDNDPAVQFVRAWLGADSSRAVWSTATNAGPGFNADSTSHGSFDDVMRGDIECTTMASVIHIVGTE